MKDKYFIWFGFFGIVTVVSLVIWIITINNPTTTLPSYMPWIWITVGFLLSLSLSLVETDKVDPKDLPVMKDVT